MKNKIKKAVTNKYVVVGVGVFILGVAVGALIATRLSAPNVQNRVSV